MLTKAQLAAIGLLVCLAVGIAWQDRITSQPPEQAVNHEGTKNPSKKTNENSYLYDAWEWATSDSISVYTLFLAAFTGVLGVTAIVQIRYLRRAAETAQLAAEHIPRVERAYVFLAIELRHKQTPNAIPDTGDIVEVQFALKNHGKTPAIISKIDAEVRTVSVLPTEIRKQAIEMPPGLVIGSGETSSYFFARNLVISADWPKIRARECLLLFVGAVEYFDIFGTSHVTGFCLDRDPMGQGFSPSPTKKLNYYT